MASLSQRKLENFYSDLSSSERATEQLAEQDQLDEEISKKYLKIVKEDPDSKNFGPEFSEITASEVGIPAHEFFGEKIYAGFGQVADARQDDALIGAGANLRKAESTCSSSYSDDTKTPFEKFFNDPKFKNISVDKIPERFLVKKVLRDGTGFTIGQILSQTNDTISTSQNIPPLKVNKFNKQMQDPEKEISNLQIGLKISFHYAAYFEHEKHPFDSTQARGEPWTEIIGIGKMIPALEKSLMTMKLNERAVILARYDLCYGESGCLNRIPKQKDCMFKVWLSSISEMTLLDQFMQLNYEMKVQALKAGKFTI